MPVGNIPIEANFFQYRIQNSVSQNKSMSAFLAIPNNQTETLGPIIDLVQLNW